MEFFSFSFGSSFSFLFWFLVFKGVFIFSCFLRCVFILLYSFVILWFFILFLYSINVLLGAIPSLFETLTKFNLSKFDELATLVILTIHTHARSIGEAHIMTWQLIKLSIE